MNVFKLDASFCDFFFLVSLLSICVNWGLPVPVQYPLEPLSDVVVTSSMTGFLIQEFLS